MVGALDQERGTVGPSRRLGWWVWLVVAVVAALGVGVVVWLALDDEVGSPTATFDGAALTYTGPDPVIVGEDEVWTLTLVNESDLEMIWVVTKLAEPGPTIEEYLEFVEAFDGSERLPMSWRDDTEFGTIYPGETIERFVKMSGTIAIDFEELDTAGYPAGFIEVVIGDE